MGRALAAGRLPLTTVRSQLGRAPLVPPSDVQATLTRQLVRFAAIGAFSTLAYLAIFLLSRPALGAQEANFVALLLTAVGNTAANRRLTFGVRGPRRRGRHHVGGLAVFALGLGLTSGSLAALHAWAQPSYVMELLVLVAANLAATLLRFLLLRRWVFARRDPATA